MAGEDARGGGGEALPEAGNARPAGGPLFEMERLSYDEAYNLVSVQRVDPKTGEWRDVSLDGPAPEPPLWMEYGTCDGAGRVSRVERVDLAGGRWRDVNVDRPMPAPDDDDDPDGPPGDQAAAAAAPVANHPPPLRRLRRNGKLIRNRWQVGDMRRRSN